MSNLIQFRSDTAANWTSVNPVLAQAEKGIETDTLKEKWGDGVTAWNSLPYTAGAALIIRTEIAITVDTEITDPIRVLEGGAFYIASGKTLTIRGPFKAGMYGVFSGSGAVLFEKGSIKYLPAKWFNASGDWNGTTGTDNIACINKAVSAAQGLVPVTMLPGNYMASGSIDIIAGTQIIGLSDYPTDYRSTLTATTITLNTSTPDTHLFTTDAGATSYIYGIRLANLALVGPSGIAGCSALNLFLAASSRFDNIGITHFARGVVPDSSMFLTFNQLSVANCSEAALYIGSTGVSTTNTFNTCTFRESPWAAIMESSSTGYSISTVFNQCTFESATVGGINIHKSCSVEFNSCNAENLPDDRVITNGVMIRAHYDGVDTSPYDSIVRINGGEWSGGNFGGFSGSAFLDCDSTKMASVVSTKVQRATYGIKATSNTKGYGIALFYPAFVSVTTLLHSSTVGKVHGIYPNNGLSGAAVPIMTTLSMETQYASIAQTSVYADNAAAVAAGNPAGTVYRTSIGHLMVVY